MDHHSKLSTYLVKPSRSPHFSEKWAGFETKQFSIRRGGTPRPKARAVAAVSLWVMLVWTFNTAVSPVQSLPVQAGSDTLSTTAAKVASAVPTAPVNLAATVKVTSLPGGPSGDPMPPGYLAPDYAYANTYTKGQCTWYVAGRREIPNNWGNAVTWYWNASASGYKTGTTAAVGAIAWTGEGRYGHVALVEDISSDGRSVYIAEMNYRGAYVKSHRWAPVSAFKYIY